MLLATYIYNHVHTTLLGLSSGMHIYSHIFSCTDNLTYSGIYSENMEKSPIVSYCQENSPADIPSALNLVRIRDSGAVNPYEVPVCASLSSSCASEFYAALRATENYESDCNTMNSDEYTTQPSSSRQIKGNEGCPPSSRLTNEIKMVRERSTHTHVCMHTHGTHIQTHIIIIMLHTMYTHIHACIYAWMYACMYTHYAQRLNVEICIHLAPLTFLVYTNTCHSVWNVAVLRPSN